MKKNKILLIMSIAYVELWISITMIIVIVINYHGILNIFSGYVKVDDYETMDQVYKKHKRAIRIDTQIKQTGIVIANEQGMVSKEYFLVEVGEYFVYLGVQKQSINNYREGKQEVINALIVKPNKWVQEYNEEIVKELNLDKKISNKYELVTYDLEDHKLLLCIILLLNLLILLEGTYRAKKKIRKFLK